MVAVVRMIVLIAESLVAQLAQWTGAGAFAGTGAGCAAATGCAIASCWRTTSGSGASAGPDAAGK